MNDAILNAVRDNMRHGMVEVIRDIQIRLRAALRRPRNKVKVLAMGSNGSGTSCSMIIGFDGMKRYVSWCTDDVKSIEVSEA